MSHLSYAPIFLLVEHFKIMFAFLCLSIPLSVLHTLRFILRYMNSSTKTLVIYKAVCSSLSRPPALCVVLLTDYLSVSVSLSVRHIFVLGVLVGP